MSDRHTTRNGPAIVRRARGTTLIEVLIAIVIFVVGMLALIHLQGNLARSGADSNARTVGGNIAEEMLEGLRAFEQVESDPAGVRKAYEDIVANTQVIRRGNIDYQVATTVDDWYFAANRESVTQTAPAGRTSSDFKVVEVSVSWEGAEFRVDDDTTSAGRLGSGTLTLTDIVPSIPTLGSARIAATDDGELSGPPVDYVPGLNPDIVSIQVDDSKFKESTTPQPVVFRRDELVESWFDVITYSQTQDQGAIFLRREEFLAVSCDCTLQSPSAGTDGGNRPIVWTGADYSEPEFVAKPFGVSATNNQSFYCDVCCRDHHDDGGSGEALADPFRLVADYHSNGALAGDHKHYGRDNSGQLTLAGAGDDYLEACRLVRKDGFMRLAQDLRQESLFSFPEDYLDAGSEVAEYSGYITDAVIAYETALADCQAENTCTDYEGAPPAWIAPGEAIPPVTFPASDPAAPTGLPTAFGAAEQQLRSRAVYQDFLGDEVRWAINCLQIDGNTGEDCGVPGMTSALEITPFFDVQLTLLARWNEDPQSIPVDVTNETVSSNNTHSRGLAQQMQDATGPSRVITTAHRGNSGLTATPGIDPDYTAGLRDYNLYVNVDDGSGSPSPPPGGTMVTGTLTSGVSGYQASNITVSGADGAQCGQTDAAFTCTVPGSGAPTLTLSGLTKGQDSYYACSSDPALTVYSPGPGTTVFYLPVGQEISGVTLVVQAAPCAG